MKRTIAQSLTGVAMTVAGLAALGLGSAPAMAGTILNGWNYGIDSRNDGTSGYLGGEFEIYGIGVHQDGDTITVGIDGRLPLSGSTGWSNIEWGDLFFNFGNQSSLAANQGSLFAVHFASNDSGLATAGLYSGVSGKNVGLTNEGYSSVAEQGNTVASIGGSSSVGDLSSSSSYWTGADYNVISSGTRVGDVNILTSTALSALGFNLDAVAGSQTTSNAGGSTRQTFGLQFQRTDAMVGSFVASIFAECLNDGVAVKGELVAPPPETKVPEPAALLGLGTILGLLKLRRRQEA